MQVVIFFISLLFFGFTLDSAEYRFKGKSYRLGKYRTEEKASFETFHINTLPESLDLTPYQTPARDQGNRGSCGFFTATGLMEAAIREHLDDTDLDINISEEYLIWKEKAINGNSSYTDGSISYLNISAFEDGFMLEKDMPYNASWFMEGMPCENREESSAPLRCYAHQGPDPSIEGRIIRDFSFSPRFTPSQSRNIIATMLEFRTPFLVSLPVNTRGWNAETGQAVFDNEMKKECDEKPELCGAHSILLIGYDAKTKKFRFKNSWSREWGEEGFGTIGSGYIDQYALGPAITAKVNHINLPPDISIPEALLENVSFKVQNNVFRNEEEGLLIEIKFALSYLFRSTAYVSAFLAIKNEPESEKEYSEVELADGKGYVAARHTFILQDSPVADFTEKPLELFIPYSIIPFDDLAGKALYIRPSIYYTTDIEIFTQIFRDYSPLKDFPNRWSPFKIPPGL